MQPREYDTLRAQEDHHWWYAVLHALVLRDLSARLPRHASVLDAGCGTGGMLDVLRTSHPGWRTQGLDASPAAVTHCHARGLENVLKGDVAALPLPDASFDAVLSLDVLYHAGVDEHGALAEMVRVLRPGGVLILNLPAFESLRGSHDRAVCGARRYKACQVREILEIRMLKVEMIHYWNAWLFLPLLLLRQWSRRHPAPDSAQVRSDLALPPRWLNGLLSRLGGVDARLCRGFGLPWGSSVFAVAVKPPAPTPNPLRCHRNQPH